MDLNTFLDHFDTIAEAPSGIAKLKALILDLAVQGKLVPQNPEDETAIKALERMQHEKVGTIQTEGYRTKNKKSSLRSDEYEIAFPLPQGWALAQLDDLCIFIDYRGQTPPKVNSGIRLITAKNVRDGFVKPDPEEFINEETYHTWMTRGFPKKGDVLFTTEAPLGKAAVVEIEERFALAQRVINFRPLSGVYGYFLMWMILSSWFQSELQERATGMTATGIKAAKLKLICIPLPPLAEQKRIVEKVDELMALCDRLAAAKQTRDDLRQKLRGSAIAALMNAETDEALEKSWAIVRDNWQTISQDPKDVDDLRRSNLQLAVKGKLVSQNSEDKLAKLTLSEIAIEQQKLAQTGKLKKDNELAEIKTEDLPSLPEGWEYCYFQDLKTFGPRNGYSPKAVEYPTSVRSITLTATTSGRFNGQFFKYIDEQIENESYLWLQPGDLLIQRSNTLAYVGAAAVYDQPPGKYIYPDLIMRVRLSEKIDVRYIHLFLSSRAGKQHFQSNASGTSGTMPKINQRVVNSLIVPLPPLAEQKRIVAKVGELMQMCDQLEANSRQSQQRASALAASAISHLTI